MMMMLLLLCYMVVSLPYSITNHHHSQYHQYGHGRSSTLCRISLKDTANNNNDIDTNCDDSTSKKKKTKRRLPKGYTSIQSTSIKSTNITTVDSISIGQPSSSYNISFTVYGEPTPLSRHMLSKGRMYNPSGMHQREFAKACESYLPLKPLEGPIEAKMIFYFDRPKYQFRTGKNSHLLKEGISNWHSTRKDLDNLIKFVLDSLNKKAYLDDSQVIAN